MAKKNVIIVGAGLFGSIAATLARRRGHTVTVVDSGEEYAASKASGCVLAPSWLTSLSGEQTEKAMGVLQELYTVHQLSLATRVGAVFKAQQVHPDEILVKPDIVDTVAAVNPGRVTLSDGRQLKGAVLVAAGIWTQNLVPEMPRIKGLYGASVRVWGLRLPEPRIVVYAPYRQAVAVNLPGGKEMWFGDGTALVEKTWMAEEKQRTEATVARMREIVQTPVAHNRIKVRVGARPYVEGHKAGYFAQAGDRLWVSTGGAKNGTVLAAWQAYRFVEEAL